MPDKWGFDFVADTIPRRCIWCGYKPDTADEDDLQAHWLRHKLDRDLATQRQMAEKLALEKATDV